MSAPRNRASSMKQQTRTPDIDAARQATDEDEGICGSLEGIWHRIPQTGTSSLKSALTLLGYTVSERFLVGDETVRDAVIVDRHFRSHKRRMLSKTTRGRSRIEISTACFQVHSHDARHR